MIIVGVIAGPAKAGRHVRSPPPLLHPPDLPDPPDPPDLPDLNGPPDPPGYCGRPCAVWIAV